MSKVTEAREMYLGEKKDIYRTSAMVSEDGKVHHRPLLLMGKNGWDLQKGFDLHTITKESQPIIVEGEENVAKKKELLLGIKEVLRRRGVEKYHIHPDRLHFLPLHLILNKGEKVDLFFADLCGQFNSNTIEWMHTYKNAGFFDRELKLATTMKLAKYETGKKFVNPYLVDYIKKNSGLICANKDVHKKLIDFLNVFDGDAIDGGCKHQVFFRYWKDVFEGFMGGRGTLYDIAEYMDIPKGSVNASPMCFASFKCDLKPEGVFDYSKINNVVHSDRYLAMLDENELPIPEGLKLAFDIYKNKTGEKKMKKKSEKYVIMVETSCGCSSMGPEQYVSNEKPLRMSRDIKKALTWTNIEDVRAVQEKALDKASKVDGAWMPNICSFDENTLYAEILEGEIEREIAMRKEENKKEMEMKKRNVGGVRTPEGKSVVMVSAGIIASARREADKMDNRQSAGAKMWGAFKKANQIREEYGLPRITSKDIKRQA